MFQEVLPSVSNRPEAQVSVALGCASLPVRQVSAIPAPWQSIPCADSQLSERILAQDVNLLGTAQLVARVIADLSAESRHFYAQPRALIVGGFVRDSILGLRPKDLDLEVYGVGFDRLNNLLEGLFPNRVDAVGKAFGVLKVHLGEGRELDISIPRKDSKQGTGHKGFQILGDPSMSITDAAARRDFTWNALAACPLEGEIFDPFGGLSDLRAGILRVTDPKLFTDDPLRVYRAAQFVARMQLSVDDQSFLLMKSLVERGELNELPAERITEELKKLLLKSPAPSRGIKLLGSLGILQFQMPEIHALIAVPQDPEWHPEGDVWTHTNMVLDAAAGLLQSRSSDFSEDERLIVLLSAISHDFGKPEKTEFVEGRYRSRGHEAAGVEPAKKFLSRFALAEHIKEGVLACTAYHMRPCELSRALANNRLNEKQVVLQIRQLVKRIAPLRLETFLTLTEADSRGRGLPGVAMAEYLPGKIIRELAQKKDIEVEVKSPLLMGRDLIQMGLNAGKKLGEILAEVERQRDRGKLNSRNDALIFVRQRYLFIGKDLQEMGMQPGTAFTKIFTGLKEAISRGEIETRDHAFHFVRQLISQAVS